MAAPKDAPDMKEVVAIKLGFHNGAMVPKGSKIYVPTTLKGKWFVPVAEAPKDLAEAQAGDGPMALSQFGKGSAKTFTQAMKK